MLGVIDHSSNYIGLFALPSKKAVVPTLYFVLTDIMNFRSSTFTLIVPSDPPSSSIVIQTNSMLRAVPWSHAIYPMLSIYTHNQQAKMERHWATLADSVTTTLQHTNPPTTI
jgi:hypothetical protein